MLLVVVREGVEVAQLPSVILLLPLNMSIRVFNIRLAWFHLLWTNYLIHTLRGFLWDIFLTVITPLGWYLTNLWQVVRQELPEQLLSVQPSHPSTTTLSERMEVDPTPEVSSELDGG